VKKATSIVLIFSLLLMSGSPALADDSDIFGKDIQPNVMLLFDTSTSMGASIPSIPYDPKVTYPGSLKSTVVYQQPKPKDTPTVYKNSIAEVPDQNARDALSTVGYWVGTIGGSKVTLRLGNYINYWNCKSCSGLEAKIDVAKRVVTDLIKNVDGVRFGVMRLRTKNPSQDRGQVIAPIGTDKATMINAVNNIVMEEGTPIGEQLYDAGQYYKGQKLIDGTTWTSPIQYECQPNFVVMFTDGKQNGKMDVRVEAQKLYAADHASWLTGKQNVIVHTVGFGLAQNDKDAGGLLDLQEAAKNGGGNFYVADDATQLQAALLDAISKIVAGTFTFASPVIPTTSTTGSTRAYVASFQSDVSRSFWLGFLKAYQRDANGKVPVDANGVPLDSALIWEAGQLLSQKLADSRTIFTFVNGKREDFTKSNPAITGALLGAGGSIYLFTDKDKKNLTREFTKAFAAGVTKVDVKLATDVPGAIAPPDCAADCYAYDPKGGDATKVAPATLGYVGGLDSAVYGNGTKLENLVFLSGIDRDTIIDVIRGIDAFDEDADGNVTEERAWKLGDIFHSSPVLVTPPFSPSADASYVAFKQANASRTTVLLAGANDGVLHAFRESDGQELWAFIPPDLLGNLKDLAVRAGLHPFYVDSSPIAADVKIGGTWKTIVVFGERRGGNYYHALDVTDTLNPIYLWSFTDAKIKETWSEPAIGKVKMDDGTEKFVAFFGGGYYTAENNSAGNAFFALDLATGQRLWEYYNDGSLDDRKYMNFSLAANPTVVDTNLDGNIDRVYIGDVGGQLWKFDVSAPATVSGGLVTNWTGKRLFEADFSQKNPPDVGEYYPAQAIYAAPTVAFDDYGDLWVYFGTGDRNHPNNNSQNNFYGIKDNTTMANDSVLTEKALEDVTSANKTAVQGWFFKLAPDEKVLSAGDVFNKIVFFSSFTPTNVVQCGSGGGDAKLYAVQALTGYAAIDWSTGTALASSDSKKVRSKAIGSGIASKPIVVINYTGSKVTASVVTATTNEQLPSNPAPAPTSLKRLIYWREVF